MMGLKSSEWLWLGLEPVNAMTNEAKTGYDSAIEQLIAFELEAIQLSDTLNPA